MSYDGKMEEGCSEGGSERDIGISDSVEKEREQERVLKIRKRGREIKEEREFYDKTLSSTSYVDANFALLNDFWKINHEFFQRALDEGRSNNTRHFFD